MQPFFPNLSLFRQMLLIGHAELILITRGYIGTNALCGLMGMAYLKLFLIYHIQGLSDYASVMGFDLLYVFALHIIHHIRRYRVYGGSVDTDSTGFSWAYLKLGIPYPLCLALEPLLILALAIWVYQQPATQQAAKPFMAICFGMLLPAATSAVSNFLEYTDHLEQNAPKAPALPKEEPLTFTTASIDTVNDERS